MRDSTEEKTPEKDAGSGWGPGGPRRRPGDKKERRGPEGRARGRGTAIIRGVTRDEEPRFLEDCSKVAAGWTTSRTRL